MYEVSVTVELYHDRLGLRTWTLTDERQMHVLRAQGWMPGEPTPALARLWGHLEVQRTPIVDGGYSTTSPHLRLRYVPIKEVTLRCFSLTRKTRLLCGAGLSAGWWAACLDEDVGGAQLNAA
jgi:hypothetical protein